MLQLLILLSLLPRPANASEEALTLSDCLRIALSSSPDLKTAEARLRAAEIERRRAWSVFHPEVSLDARHTLYGYDETNRINRGDRFSSDTREFTLRGNINLFNSGRDWAAVQAARSSSDEAGAALEEARQAVAHAVTRAYFEVLSAQRRAVLEGEGLKTARESLKMTEGLYRSGIRSYPDVLNARVQVLGVRKSALRSGVGLSSARAVLNILLDRAPLEETLLADVPSGERKAGRLEDHLEKALRLRPELRRAHLALEGSRLRSRQALLRAFPSLTLEGLYSHRLEAPRAQIAPGVFVTPTNPFWQVNLGLSVPFWDGAGRALEYRAAQARVRQEEAEAEGVRRRVTGEVSRAFLRLVSSLEILVVARDEKKAAGERSKAVMDLYREGKATALEATTAQNQLRAAGVEEVQAHYESWLAQAELEKAVGVMEVSPR